jgi:hypothetical protein
MVVAVCELENGHNHAICATCNPSQNPKSITSFPSWIQTVRNYDNSKDEMLWGIDKCIITKVVFPQT